MRAYLWLLPIVALSFASHAGAGAADRTCMQDSAAIEGGLRVSLANPRTCPPGDLLVSGGPRPIVLPRARWSNWIGAGRLPARVFDFILWVQADGDESILRATRVSDGVTTALARGGFLPDFARSGPFVAVTESRDPIPNDMTLAIAHRVVVVDFSTPSRPRMHSSPPLEAPGMAFEHFFDVRGDPGTFWALLTGPSGFRVARWRGGATMQAAFAGSYRSYAYLAIDPVCGNVAFDACDRSRPLPRCEIEIESLDGTVARTFDLPTRVGDSPLPWEGEVTRLRALAPDGVTYDWMSLTTYAVAPRTIAFRRPCHP